MIDMSETCIAECTNPDGNPYEHADGCPNKPINVRDCKHGRLKRSCTECLDEKEIADLTAENAALKLGSSIAHKELNIMIGQRNKYQKRLFVAEAERDTLAKEVATLKAERSKREAQHITDLCIFEDLRTQIGERCKEIGIKRNALKNVLMLVSSRKELRESENGKHLMRFCAEAGVVPTILRKSSRNPS